MGAPITPDPDERDYLPVDQALPNETLSGSFPTEESPNLPPISPKEQHLNKISPAIVQRVYQQTIVSTEDQQLCEQEDQTAEPNPPLEDLTHEAIQSEE